MNGSTLYCTKWARKSYVGVQICLNLHQNGEWNEKSSLRVLCG